MAARKRSGLTQQELGLRVGVAQQQIARWEASGYLTASLERVDLVAGALGIRCRLSGTVAPRGQMEVYTDAIGPVRDVGEIAVRIRAHGRELHERFGIEHVGVFGSFACGRQTDSSDVDLLVGMPEPGGFSFIEAAEYLEDLLGREVDVLRPEGVGPRLRRRVTREEIRVWGA